MATFKTWKVTFTAEIVSTYNISEPTSTCIHEALSAELRKTSCGTFLVGAEETRIEQTGGDDE